ncbi:mandelate racemase/muconate lactonizing enzyme family protein [Haloplanus litoreus]|uniref:Mandelate racemase/muconate lactonizing enzyme family protein n=1 Tax=Haloplanus litoreus TaxID=767515 RepID=A0ABD6A0E1_9EURY
MIDVSVESVETIGLSATLEDRFGYAQEWVDSRSAVLVRIEADDGTVGWGECWGPVAGTREIVEEVLAPTILGENPLHVERLYDHLYDAGRATYQTVVPLPAISGLDIALWDLKGKLMDQPVSVLLGGREREEIRAYATGHYFRDTADLGVQYSEIADEAAANADRLGALKLKTGLSLLGYGPTEDVELVRRVRERVGDDVTMMVDANYAYTRREAREVGRRLDGLGVHWFEEPVAPEDIDGYASLRADLEVPIAGGECHTPTDFTRLFDVHGLDIAQPDVCIVGGLTPGRRIVTRAEEHGIDVVPHAWGTPVGLAASLHLIATVDREPWLEYDRSPNPIRDALTGPGITPDDGTVSIPSAPGLGVDVDLDAVADYRIDGGDER